MHEKRNERSIPIEESPCDDIVRWISERQEDTSGETNSAYNSVLDFWSLEM